MADTASEFKIALLAPSRVGKTSLIAAMLQDTKEILAGKPLSIRPKNSATNARITQHVNQLRGSLSAGRFDAGAMSGTESPFEFSLLLDNYNQEDNGLTIKLLDFPGGWLSSLVCADGFPEQRACAQFVRDASVLLLVVDASLIMEAATISERSVVDTILNVGDTANVVEEWAKCRRNANEGPPVVVIAPVKCESYFDDNGGRRDRSRDLFEAVCKQYKAVIKKIQQESDNEAVVLYMPVDTVGCVEFMGAKWEDLETDSPIFKPSFRVRPKSDQSIRGASDILLAVCRQILYAQNRKKRERADVLKAESDEAADRARNKSPFEWFLSIFGKTASDIRAEKAQMDAAQALQAASTVSELVDALAQKPFGPRVKEIPHYEGEL